MDLGLWGKVCIVTGGSRGIGKAIAIELAREKANVVVCGIDKYYDYYTSVSRAKKDSIEELEDVARQIGDMGCESLAIKADVSKRRDVEKVVKMTMDRFGRIDVLASSVGLALATPLEQVTDADWDLHDEVLLKSNFYWARAVIPIMKKQGGGKIIMISSIAAKDPWPFLAAYCAAKAGVCGLVRELCDEFSANNIEINAVCPGATETKLMRASFDQYAKGLGISVEEFEKATLQAIPTRRISRPEDIAYLVTFLASDKADQITGQSINVSGGQTKW